MNLSLLLLNSKFEKARLESINGVEYYVAPTVSIVEGVMNSTLYLNDEMEIHFEAWNGTPLILEHPIKDGEKVSANTPDLLPNILGRYFNAKIEDKSLKGEWWLEKEKLDSFEKGRLIANSLLNGVKLEQSTALYALLENKQGEYNGETYDNIARSIKPDHVAILLNEKGACSVKDGCGTPRISVNQAEQPENTITIDLSSINEKIKEHGKKILHIVNRLSINNLKGNNQMTREEIINWILENSTLPVTRAMLDAASDEELQEIANSMLPAEVPETFDETSETTFSIPTAKPPESGEEPKPVTPVDTTPTTDIDIKSMDITSMLPKRVAKVLNELTELEGVGGIIKQLRDIQESQNAQFTNLTSLLAANSNYTEDDLKDLPPAFVQKMAGEILQNSAVRQQQTQIPYLGLGDNYIHNAPDSDWVEYKGDN